MASGLVCRANRPNTWLHRPACKREEKPCQLGAVYTWHKADMRCWLAPMARGAFDPFRLAEEVTQFGRGFFGNFLWKEMTGIERPATDIGRPGSP